MNQQVVLVVEGPDNVGKTNIAKALSHHLGIPYFKVSTEKDMWRRGRFKDALELDQTYISQFLEQTKHSVIIDRAWPSEHVYSRVFGRETNDAVLEQVDERFAAMGTIVVLLLRRNYDTGLTDELVPNDKLEDLHRGYIDFAQTTKCKVLTMYVDDFGNDLSLQIPKLSNGIIGMRYDILGRHRVMTP